MYDKSTQYQSPESQGMKLYISIFITLIITGLGLSGCGTEYDLIIRGGNIIDGSGQSTYIGDIGIKGNKISMVGDLSSSSASQEINANGLTVSPGFIDVHSHAGRGLIHEDRSDAKNLLTQGLTTVIINPDGGGYVDLNEQDSALLEDGIGVNVIQMVPHGSVRLQVMGMEDRLATPAEMDSMKLLIKNGMDQGAFGLSSGPFYAPGSFSDTEELVELTKVISPYNGIYASHIRDESNYTIGLEAAVDEVITVAREAEVTGIVTHIKALGPPVWGKSVDIIEKIETARSKGISVYADQYPYNASATGLGAALLPRWSQAGGRDALLKRLDHPDTLEMIKSEMAENLKRRGGADRIQFRYFNLNTIEPGKSLQEMAEIWNKDPIETAITLLQESTSVGIISFNMNDEDVNRFMKQEWMMTCSDGSYPKWGSGVPHPRSIGSFPRKIRKYVNEEKVISMEKAIRSMTGLSADVFGIPERGYIKESFIADIVIFDPDKLTDKATFTEPFQLSEGIIYSIINGQLAIENSTFNDIRKGTIIKKK